MQEESENTIIETMLVADKNACRVVEEAKEKGNKMVLQAREEAHTLIEKTKNDLQKNRQAFEKKLLSVAEKQIAEIVSEKKKDRTNA